MNILQAKISALEKELDAEKTSAASLQARFNDTPTLSLSLPLSFFLYLSFSHTLNPGKKGSTFRFFEPGSVVSKLRGKNSSSQPAQRDLHVTLIS